MLVTAPIFYTNSDPHIGAAHTMILCDFIARSHRALGHDVFLSVGTDEHGDKIFNAAQKENKDTKTFVDEKYTSFKKLADSLDISYNRFIRTTDEDHIHAVQHYWNKLEEKGYIYKGIYSGYYSFRDETFFQQDELVDEKAPTGAPVVFLEE
jgi:methionyl-tRNA synthetase